MTKFPYREKIKKLHALQIYYKQLERYCQERESFLDKISFIVNRIENWSEFQSLYIIDIEIVDDEGTITLGTTEGVHPSILDRLISIHEEYVITPEQHEKYKSVLLITKQFTYLTKPEMP